MSEVVTLTFTEPSLLTRKFSVSTNANGKFNYQFASDKIGQWYIQANWNGNEKYLPSSSNSLSFIVNPSAFLITGADIPTFKISPKIASSGNTIYLDIQIKNTGNTSGWAWPFVMIIGPCIGDTTYTNKIYGEPVFVEPGQSVIRGMKWIVPADAPVGDYISTFYVFDGDPSNKNSKTLASKAGWFMNTGASFIQLEGNDRNRIIHIHLEGDDVEKVRRIVGKNVISINELYTVLKASGLTGSVNDDDLSISSDVPPMISIPESNVFDIVVIQQFGYVGRIYGGSFVDVLDKVSVESIQDLSTLIPKYGEVLDVLYTFKDRDVMPATLKIVIKFVPLADTIVSVAELFAQEGHVDKALLDLKVPNFVLLHIPDPITIQKISPTGNSYMQEQDVQIAVKLTDSIGNPILGARVGYWIDLQRRGMLTHVKNGVYAATIKIEPTPLSPAIQKIQIIAFKQGGIVGFTNDQFTIGTRSIIDTISNFLKSIFGW